MSNNRRPPRYSTSCQYCRYLGQYKEFDVYLHVSGVTAPVFRLVQSASQADDFSGHLAFDGKIVLLPTRRHAVLAEAFDMFYGRIQAHLDSQQKGT